MTTPNTPDQRIDDILDNFIEGCDCRIDEGQAYLYTSEFAADEAKSALRAIVDEMMNEARGDVPPCEPDCTTERHAYHQGAWDFDEAQRQRIPQILDKYFKGGK